MPRLVSIVSNDPGRSTTYLADDGQTYTLSGDISARANNPGNISPAGRNARDLYETQFGAIGYIPSSAGQPAVAVFPDISSGQAAQAHLWQTPVYQNMTLDQAARSWAASPYPGALRDAAGVSGDTLVRNLSPEQFNAVIAAQNANEGSPNLSVTDGAGQALDPAIFTGTHPVPPVNIGSARPIRSLADIHDLNELRKPLPFPGPLQPPASTQSKVGRTLGATGGALGPALGVTSTLGWNAAGHDQSGDTVRRSLPPDITENSRRVAGATGPGALSDAGTDALRLPAKDMSAGGRVLGGAAGTGSASLGAQQRPTIELASTEYRPAKAPAAQQLLRLPSGQMIAPGTYPGNNGMTSVVTAGPNGTAIVTPQRAGLINAGNEANAPTIAGGLIRAKVPEAIGQGFDAVKSNAGQVANTVSQTASDTVNNLGGQLKSLGSSAIGALGNLGNTLGYKAPAVPAPPVVRPVAAPVVAAGANGTLEDIHDARDSAAMTATQRVAPIAPAAVARPAVVAPVRPVVAPAVAPRPANNNGGSSGGIPSSQTFKGTSTGRTYVVGQQYANGNGTFVAQSNGTFKKVG